MLELLKFKITLVQKGSKRVPKGFQKGSKREPKGNQKGTKREPKGKGFLLKFNRILVHIS
jgi:hypothetical protein